MRRESKILISMTLSKIICVIPENTKVQYSPFGFCLHRESITCEDAYPDGPEAPASRPRKRSLFLSQKASRRSCGPSICWFSITLDSRKRKEENALEIGWGMCWFSITIDKGGIGQRTVGWD